nr:MAG TPA: Baseplate structural protein [Caudoviricetes sp.]
MAIGAFYPNNKIDEDGTARQVKMSFGSDLPHNNIPPYYSVYIWRRVA